MIRSATRILRLGFKRQAPPESDASPPKDQQIVEIIGYCRQFLFSGSLDLDADRLTDLLNGCDEIELIDVVVQWLDDGQVLEQPQVTLPRGELLAVQAGAPRGNPARRRPTRQAAASGSAGPYTYDGYLHTRRGADPAMDIGRRDPMIPLTDATISFALASVPVVNQASTLIVNRDVAVALRPAGHGDRIAVA